MHALDAVVDAALARSLQTVWLCRCNLSPASAPALARLLGGGALRALDLENDENEEQLLLDAPAAVHIANALRANSTLEALYLYHVQLWLDPAAATALLDALTGHRSLRKLRIWHNSPGTADQAAGAAFGALVAANSAALQELDLSYSNLNDAALGPLFDALPHNTHLRKLVTCNEAIHFEADEYISEAFAHDRMLPAVRANSSLCSFPTDGGWEEATRIVELRAQLPATN
jgi:hypothetical protein